MTSLIQKIFKKETAVESAGILLLFSIIERIIQIFRGIIFARVLGPSEYGVFTLAFFFIPLVITFAKLGIPSCYARYAPQYEKKGMLGDFFRRNYLLTTGASVFFTVIALIFSKQVSEFIYDSTEYKHIIILCALTVVPYVLYENFLSSFTGLRIFKMGALLRFSQFIGFTALGITVVFIYPQAYYLILANLVSFIFVLTAFGFIVWKYILYSDSQDTKIREDDYYRKIFKYSIWLISFAIIEHLFKYTDRLMLNKFLGLEEVGIYSIALNVAQLLFFFGMIAGNVLMPNLSRIWENGEKSRVVSLLNLSIKINIFLLLFLAILISLFKDQIITLLYSDVYIKSVSVVDILLIFSLLTSANWTIGGYAGIIEKTYIHTVVMIIGLIGNVALNYFLIPLYQLEGAAVATTVSFIISFIVINYWFYREGLKLRLSTIFMYIIPIILLFNSIIMSIVFSLLIIIAFGTEFIITKNEKIILKQQMKKVFNRVKA